MTGGQQAGADLARRARQARFLIAVAQFALQFGTGMLAGVLDDYAARLDEAAARPPDGPDAAAAAGDGGDLVATGLRLVRDAEARAAAASDAA